MVTGPRVNDTPAGMVSSYLVVTGLRMTLQLEWSQVTWAWQVLVRMTLQLELILMVSSDLVVTVLVRMTLHLEGSQVSWW